MNWIQKLLAGLALINQLLPALLLAIATGKAQIKPIKFSAGSTYRIAGGARDPDGQPNDELIITVV